MARRSMVGLQARRRGSVRYTERSAYEMPKYRWRSAMDRSFEHGSTMRMIARSRRRELRSAVNPQRAAMSERTVCAKAWVTPRYRVVASDRTRRDAFGKNERCVVARSIHAMALSVSAVISSAERALPTCFSTTTFRCSYRTTCTAVAPEAVFVFRTEGIPCP